MFKYKQGNSLDWWVAEELLTKEEAIVFEKLVVTLRSVFPDVDVIVTNLEKLWSKENLRIRLGRKSKTDGGKNRAMLSINPRQKGEDATVKYGTDKRKAKTMRALTEKDVIFSVDKLVSLASITDSEINIWKQFLIGQRDEAKFIKIVTGTGANDIALTDAALSSSKAHNGEEQSPDAVCATGSQDHIKWLNEKSQLQKPLVKFLQQNLSNCQIVSETSLEEQLIRPDILIKESGHTSVILELKYLYLNDTAGSRSKARYAYGQLLDYSFNHGIDSFDLLERWFVVNQLPDDLRVYLENICQKVDKQFSVWVFDEKSDKKFIKVIGNSEFLFSGHIHDSV
jgi:hypothetical protein